MIDHFYLFLVIAISYLLGSTPTSIIAGKQFEVSILENMVVAMREEQMFLEYWDLNLQYLLFL